MEEAGNRRFVAVGAEPSNNVQEGRSVRVISPLWMSQIVGGAAWTKGLQCSQHQKAIGSYRQSWVTGHGLLVAHLSLADSQRVFFITMVNFNLPSIEACTNEQLARSIEIGRQEVSWLAIVDAGVLGELVGHRSDHYQSESPLPGPTLPQHPFYFFVSNAALFASQINPCPTPSFVVLAYLFWSEYLLVILAPRAAWSRKAKSGILAAASHQMGPIQFGTEHRLVRKAPVSNNDQWALAPASLVYAVTKASNHVQSLSREIVCLFQLPVLLVILLTGALARLLQGRGFLKTDRHTTRMLIALLIVRKQYRRLQETQAPQEVNVKRRRQRIPPPPGPPPPLAPLPTLRIPHTPHPRHLPIP